MVIAVIRYSQLIPADISATIAEFVKKTGLTAEKIAKIAQQGEKNETGVIYQYKAGTITTDVFRSNLKGTIEAEGGCKLADNEFDACWNAMCKVDKLTLPNLPENVLLHVIGHTNHLHHQFIQTMLAGLSEQYPNIKISYTLSFEKKTLDPASLRDFATKYITKHYPDSEIKWHDEDESLLADIIIELTTEQIDHSYDQINPNVNDSSESFEKLDDVDVLGDRSE